MAPRPKETEEGETEGLLSSQDPTEQEEPEAEAKCQPLQGNVLVIPAASPSGGPQQALASTSSEESETDTESETETAPLLDSSECSTRTSEAGSQQSGPSTSKDERSLCRICLEEDAISNLEAPCACSGTQMHAHHACIQRWVEEKGHLRCEICDQQYSGEYDVPPPLQETAPTFSPMYVIDMNNRAVEARAAGHMDLFDDNDPYERNPGASWCMTLAIFVMFLVVMHQSVDMADNMDYDGGMAMAPPPPPPPARHLPDDDQYPDSVSLLLILIASKALFIAIPLLLVMRIAGRHAQREQYEAMLRRSIYDAAVQRQVYRYRAARGPSVV